MKKKTERILGRRMAREIETEELRHARGGFYSTNRRTGPTLDTITAVDPPDADPEPSPWV